MDEKQPWITCYVTDILLSYVREALNSEDQIDYAGLFRGVEGFETPGDPKSYLADVKNWVPLSILRELEAQCERISGRKDIAYLAAKAYFAPGRKQLPSLFEVILQILHDVRSTMLFANAWGASQTNYLKLQSFERPTNDQALYILAQFDHNAGPAIGAINLLKGFVEGVPRIFPSDGDVACIEEISQLRLDDILREFPLFSATCQGDTMIIRGHAPNEPVITAIRVCLQTETIPFPNDPADTMLDSAVVNPGNGEIDVLTAEAVANPQKNIPAHRYAYQVTTPGTISHGPLTYEFKRGQIYDAPYCRFRVAIKEPSAASHEEISVERLRKEVSKLLFDQLRQTKQTHTRIVQMSVEKHQLAAENVRLRREFQREYSFAGLIGQSKQMQELFGLIRSIAETDVTVLIHGETGTGKELIARAIHYNGPRRNKRFVAINCGALSLTLLESELFGHEKGAFTGAVGLKKGIFEIADGGTLFLDEIGEISPSTQVKLLRVLQEGEVQRVGGTDTIKVSVRIIAATNQNLDQMVAKGGFRQDLYYRLNVFPLAVPPLRERIDDIPLLVSHFVEKSQQLTKKPVKDITAPALALLMAYGWPGNIRELENTIQRMMVVCKGEILDVEDIPLEIRGNSHPPVFDTHHLKGISRESTELVEKRTIAEALKKTAGNVTHAAKALGISRATLQNKMKAYGLRNTKP
jgi:DNA-binding NtrC family response regulator